MVVEGHPNESPMQKGDFFIKGIHPEHWSNLMSVEILKMKLPGDIYYYENVSSIS